MKRKLRGLKRRDIQLDFNLYRVKVSIRGVAGAGRCLSELKALKDFPFV